VISCDKDCSGNPFAQRQKVGAKSLVALAIDKSIARARRPNKESENENGSGVEFWSEDDCT
jgi:hypothetical protein